MPGPALTPMGYIPWDPQLFDMRSQPSADRGRGQRKPMRETEGNLNREDGHLLMGVAVDRWDEKAPLPSLKRYRPVSASGLPPDRARSLDLIVPKKTLWS